MKITMVHGQNHKGSTYQIGRILAEQLAREEEITEFFLPRDLNHFCLGCYACVEEETACPFYQQKKQLADAMEAADVLIFTTPNYCMAPSGPMKAMIDLFFQYWIPHRPRQAMFFKKAVVIATTAGMGARQAIGPVKRTLKYWGVPYVKSYGLAVQAAGWTEVSAQKKRKIETDMAALAKRVRTEKAGKPSLYIRLLFQMMVLTRRKPEDQTAEKKYWAEHGWLEKKRPWRLS